MTCTKTTKSIKLVIDSNLEVVFLAGLAVRAFCSFVPFDEVAVYQVELSVIEAVNNVIKHAYGNQKGHEVEILVLLHLDRLSFQIRDTGLPLDPDRIQTMDFDPDNLGALPEGGMGMHIMQSVMDQVEYRRCGDYNVLTLSKFFQKH